MDNIEAHLQSKAHNIRGYKYSEINISLHILNSNNCDQMFISKLVYSLIKNCFSKFNSGQSDCSLRYKGGYEKFTYVNLIYSTFPRLIEQMKVNIQIDIICDDEQSIGFTVDSIMQLYTILEDLNDHSDLGDNWYKINVCFKDIISQSADLISYNNSSRNLKFIFDNCIIDSLYLHTTANIQFINNSQVCLVSESDLNDTVKDSVSISKISSRLNNVLCNNNNSLLKFIMTVNAYDINSLIFGYNGSTDYSLVYQFIDKLEALGEDIESIKVCSYSERYLAEKTVYVDESSQVLLINAVTDMGRICYGSKCYLSYSKCDNNAALQTILGKNEYSSLADMISIISYEGTDYFPVNWKYNSKHIIGESLANFSNRIFEW